MKHLARNPPSTPWIRTSEPLIWLNSSGHQAIIPNAVYSFDYRHGADARLATAPLISRAMNAIHKHGLEPDCNVETIAEEIGCSREHLTRVFSSATGVTPADYLMQHRLSEAARQLRVSVEKLDSIARRC